MTLRKLLALLPLYAFFTVAPALAQTSPPVAACGLPAQGNILVSVTYTLSADCMQTGTINIANTLSVTINGGGHAITGGAHTFILLGPSATLNLNSVTLDGENKARPGLIVGSTATVNLTSVSIIRSRATAVSMLNGSLSNVIFEENRSRSFGITQGGIVSVKANGAATLSNVVLRNNLGGGGAIRLETGATLTASGCLTMWGNAPFDINGSFTDSSTGACAGTIGNGHSATATSPGVMSCGLPAPGTHVASATFTLTADCAWTAPSIISKGVTLRIIGNGHRITSSLSSPSIYTAYTANLVLENVALDGVSITNWGALSANRLKAVNAAGFILNGGTVTITDGLFEKNRAATYGSVVLAYGTYNKGQVVFNNAAFRANTGGDGALVAILSPADIALNGCIIFDGNSPADTAVFSATLTDNRAECDSTIVDPLRPPVVPSAPSAPEPICNPHCPELQLRYCDIQLGAIGLVCRPPAQPPQAYIYRITSDSEGFFKLGISQPQVESLENGLAACSADGRVAVRVGLRPEIRHFFEISPKYHAELLVPRRYIVISKGPNVEGKVNHVVLDNALDGRVFGTVSTHGGPPAAECISTDEPATRAAPAPVCAPFVQQAPQTDGSIVHTVRTGDTVNCIAVAYAVDPLTIIILNQLENMGHWIYPGQELIVREAGA